jgi:hypothetical protein
VQVPQNEDLHDYQSDDGNATNVEELDVRVEGTLL